MKVFAQPIQFLEGFDRLFVSDLFHTVSVDQLLEGLL